MNLQSECHAVISTAIDGALRTATTAGTEEHRRVLSTARAQRDATEQRYREALSSLKRILEVEREKLSDEQAACAARDACPMNEAPQYAARHRAAQDVAAAATRQAGNATATANEAEMAFNAARQKVESAADALLDAEAEILAGIVGHLLHESITRGEALRQHIPNALNTPVDRLREPSSKVAQMLERLEMATRDDLNTPSDILRNGPQNNGLHAQRRAALIAQAAA